MGARAKFTPHHDWQIQQKLIDLQRRTPQKRKKKSLPGQQNLFASGTPNDVQNGIAPIPQENK